MAKERDEEPKSHVVVPIQSQTSLQKVVWEDVVTTVTEGSASESVNLDGHKGCRCQGKERYQ